MFLSLDAALAAKLFKAVGVAVGKEPNRIALTGVQWKCGPAGNTFTATDSYRAHVVTLGETPYTGDIVMSGEIVKAVASVAKAAGKNGYVTLELVDGDTGKAVVVSGITDGGTVAISTATVTCIDVEFPNIEMVLARAGASDGLPVFYSGKYLGSTIDAATVWSGDQICVDSVHTMEPGKVTARNDYGVFTGIIMPQRAGR